jgi:monoamine oxidase
MAPHECDVAVIGGGFAGVTAARELRRRGLEVLLLEARDRLGGRTFTTEREGHRVELGGTWVHWFQPHVWREILFYGLHVEETPGALPERAIHLAKGGRREGPAIELLAQVIPALDAYFEASRHLWERPYETRHGWSALVEQDSTSALARLRALDLPESGQDLVEGMLEVFGHCRADQVSYADLCRWHALSGYSSATLLDTTARYKITEGTQALVRAMLKDGEPEVRLGSTVHRIEQSGDRVRVKPEVGPEVTARAAVLALPLNVLRDIDFSPALSPHMLELSRETHAGSGFKVFFEVKGDLGSLIALGGSSVNPLSLALTYSAGSDHTLLVGFGADADRIDIEDRKSVEEAFRAYVPDAEVTKSFGHDWKRDPYSQGTWCSYRPGQLTRHWQELRGQEGRVVFAGADFCEGWRGFIDGAIGSGAAAARRAVRLFEA